jgi:2-C-methyl-D-erythritol 4-phosphate cytidylyltransferase
VRVVAVVVAGSAHALTPVAGIPSVLLAVRALLAGAPVERVTVLAADVPVIEVEAACAGAPVDVLSGRGTRAHTLQRRDATGSDALVTACGDDVVLLHDACRPLAPVELATAVVEAVRGGHDVAVPTLPLTDTVKTVDARGTVTGTADRATLRVMQTPIAVRAELLPGEAWADPFAVVRSHLAAGGDVHTVAGHPAAFAVLSEWDRELAELIADGRISL